MSSTYRAWCAAAGWTALFVLIFSTAAARAELKADELLLIVNTNQPAGRELAEFYAQQRNVPAGRILTIDVPDVDEISSADYDLKIVGPLRRFLAEQQLVQKVRCVVTFYGVPLRIRGRKAGPNDAAETLEIRKQLFEVEKNVGPIVLEFETIGREIDPSLGNVSGTGLAFYAQRIDQIVKLVQPKLTALSDVEKRNEYVRRLNDLNAKLRGPVEVGPDGKIPTSQPAGRLSQAQVDELVANREEPDARGKLRVFARENAGLFGLATVLTDQLNVIASTETDASIDSELSLIPWPNYPRGRWLNNPLSVRVRVNNPPPVLMTARLDAPTPELVRKMIETSIRVEKTGLKGKLVLDARGIAERKADGSVDGFGQYDQYIRNAAQFYKGKAGVEVVFDNRPPFYGPNSVEGVALYCGWYSVRNYIPAFKFVDGAVGFHVASWELISMHDPNEKGWVPNLIKANVVATTGAVAEPYLHAFPRPDDFFPLLMTGKLTLAEVYWKTNPLVSWKMTLVGDPLYKPFATNAPISVDQLPEPLKAAVR